MSKVFIDTNILVYCLDGTDQSKKACCRKLIRDLTAENLGVLSTQVLQEKYGIRRALPEKKRTSNTER